MLTKFQLKHTCTAGDIRKIQRLYFSTNLLWESNLALTTKVVAHEIIYLMYKFQVDIMHRTPVMRFLVLTVFCVTRFMQFIFFHSCLELYVSIEMMKMLSLMQTTHVSDGWFNSR